MQVLERINIRLTSKYFTDSINMKVLNGGAWGRGGSERIRFSLPRELEDFVPEVEFPFTIPIKLS